MSELKVNTIESNNTLTANSLTVGNVTINSIGITSPTYVINTSAIAIGNSSANIAITANMSISSIVLGYDPATNIFPIPNDIYQWASSAGLNNCTISRDNTIEKSPYGGIPFKITPTGADPYPTTYGSNTWNLAPTYNSDIWKVSGYIRANTPLTMTSGSFLLILPANSSGSGYSTAGFSNANPSVTVAGNTWTYFEQTFIINGNANTAYMQIRPDGYDTTTPIWYDGLSINKLNDPKTTYTSFITETVNTQIFTANGTWTKPSWATDGKELVIAHMWGGGGGSAGNTSSTTVRAGGGGGAFVFGYFIANNLSSTQAVIVGDGGLGNSTIVSNTYTGGTGGSSSFANLIAYGGGGGIANSGTQSGGGGGGWFSAGQTSLTDPQGGGPLGGNNFAISLNYFYSNSTFGGGAGDGNGGDGGSSIYGGGGGAGSTGTGGNTIFGGGGGQGPWASSSRGTSYYGGSGGLDASAGGAGLGLIPGGGGAWRSDGARGEVRIYTLRIIK